MEEWIGSNTEGRSGWISGSGRNGRKEGRNRNGRHPYQASENANGMTRVNLVLLRLDVQRQPREVETLPRRGLARISYDQRWSGCATGVAPQPGRRGRGGRWGDVDGAIVTSRRPRGSHRRGRRRGAARSGLGRRAEGHGKEAEGRKDAFVWEDLRPRIFDCGLLAGAGGQTGLLEVTTLAKDKYDKLVSYCSSLRREKLSLSTVPACQGLLLVPLFLQQTNYTIYIVGLSNSCGKLNQTQNHKSLLTIFCAA
ncbi:hypothetical protein EVAR_6946_1 [Eumeta japonica]|uniref:Uncharacterized protein n=1 Tax=Eumeta variegata TaxID=151549 RepID=A0A4C1TJM5_EUMVA|nr:hypothetical protein EVAR_6946_1 [Eumeta japonica]